MNHSPYPVVLDACVLYPSLLRDLLIRLGLTGLYQPKWTAAIHDEWQRNLLINRADLTPAQLKRTEALMNRAVPDAMVTGYEELIEGISLPDMNDCHVVAAAVRCNAEVIVTANLKDFPLVCMSDFDVEALHPDEFISDLFDLNHALALSAVREQRANLKKPPVTVEEYLESLLRQGLPMTVKSLEKYRTMI
ncbi:PIN domain-containing protein [Entomohabitans teleogrylli]|uniref:PIN domain-containing protein n=1 Tax=Entomohabitans teleogrylli TaxID=1384589 RepID=UPI00073D87D2|nr:PIN domain-containing protein [Entomohabitans teleogrylli]